MSEPKSVNLYFTEGSSDKVYQAQLARADGGWVVTFQYGRRGKPLKSGEKTKEPVDYAKAEKIYEKLVKSKTSKGYTEQEDGAVFTSAEHAGRKTTYRPQLLNAFTREEGLTADDTWLAQEKHDGERRGVISDRNCNMIFANRRGLEVAVQQPIADAIAVIQREFPDGFSLDGEDMGDHLVVFDIPDWNGQPDDAPFSHRAESMRELQRVLDRHADAVKGAIIIDHPIPFFEFKKTRLPEIEERGGEGYVLKDPDAPYLADRPNSGGPAMKVKFTESATCRVIAQNDDRRSVALELLDERGAWTPVGNVTIPADADVPASGSLVEIEYLYAYRGGSLFQPVYKGERSDLSEAACTMSQLKFKTEALSLEDRRLAVAEAAFEAEAFDGYVVEAVNGWETNGAGRLERVVFFDVGEEATRSSTYVIEFDGETDRIIRKSITPPERMNPDSGLDM